MRYSKVFFSLLVIIVPSFLFQHCGDDPVKESDRVEKLLTTGTWNIQSVTVGGVNKNELFTYFTLRFSDGGFTANDGEPVWPASGVWSFVDEKAKAIVRGDGIVVTLDEITETSLIISMDWDQTTLAGGKSKSIQGSHVFVFGK
jgi:hypothetical protein